MSSPAFLSLLFLLLSISAIATKSVYEALEDYGFPSGLIPKGVNAEYDLDEATGRFNVYMNQSCSFTIQGYPLKYKSRISGVITKDRLKDLKGVSVKLLLFWVNIVEIKHDDDDLYFSVGIASADFPDDGFEESPQCGCGFDCVNGIGEVRGERGVNLRGFVASA